jgi:YYY domain-containing protein
MLIVVVWWLWIQVIGLAALPLSYRFFRWLPDRGYVFARPLGLLLASYLLWLGGSLGLLHNSIGGMLFSVAIVSVVSLAVYWRGRSRADGDPGLLAWLRSHKRLVIAVEVLFVVALAGWALIRAYSPEVTTAGGEKFMELMYLNSIGRSDYFPPHDAWLSGYAISYYYFGYVMIAALTRLSGFAAHLTFNVGLALLFALTCTGGFGLVYNLVKGAERIKSTRARPIAWGFLGAILVAVLGNLEGFLEVLYSSRLLPAGFWRWLDIDQINAPFNLSLTPSLMPTRSGWWWWQASRVIRDLDPLGKPMGVQPIDEFPGFSFLLGDMHPHVLALPFVLLALALVLNVLFAARENPDHAGEPRSWLAPLRQLPLLVPLCLGALGFLNTWDFPIYLLVFVAAYALGRWRVYRAFNRSFLGDVGLVGAAVAVLGVLFYLPFYIGFQSQASGLLPTIYVGTRFRQYFVMFGPFLVIVAGFLVILARNVARQASLRGLVSSWAGWTAGFLLVPLGLMLFIVLVLLLTPQGRELLDGIRNIPAVQDIVGNEPWGSLVSRLLAVKLRTWVMPLTVAGMAGLGVTLLQRLVTFPVGHAGRSSSLRGAHSEPLAANPDGGQDLLHQPIIQFVLLCAVVGLLLTLSVEFFYLVDNFRVRMNTIFKFYFQAWVLLAIASAFAVYWLSREKSRLRTVFLAGFWLLFGMGMVYPVLGNISRAGNFAHSPTLDGTAYLATDQADDYAAISWLNQNVDGAPVILEAPGSGGSSYVYEGRISALTGLPAVLGWAGHEGQWRGSYTIQQARDPDIETLYNTTDPQEALALLAKYNITYVYVGPLEQSKYSARGLAKFESLMDVAYRGEGVTIYRTRK